MKCNPESLHEANLLQMKDIFNACKKGTKIRIPAIILGGLATLISRNQTSSIKPIGEFLADLARLGKDEKLDLSKFEIFSLDYGEIKNVTSDVLKLTNSKLINYSNKLNRFQRRHGHKKAHV